MTMLHIYAQPEWHCDAYILGDRESLARLRDALTRALDTGQPQTVEAFTSDGEGFSAVVAVCDDDNLALPYTDEAARERDSGHVRPDAWVAARSHL